MDDLENIEEMRIEKGIGIWGNTECIQCGACCDEWNDDLYKTGRQKTEQCPNFEIKEGKASCKTYEGERKSHCDSYFCGNARLEVRLDEGRDEKFRERAKTLKTMPKDYKIPTRVPKEQ